MKPGTRAFRTFGDIAGSYMVVAKGANNSRLLVKLMVQYPPGPKGWFVKTFLLWDDLVMMRRQLLNLKQLAEASQ